MYLHEPDVLTAYLKYLEKFYSIEKNGPLVSGELCSSVMQVLPHS